MKHLLALYLASVLVLCITVGCQKAKRYPLAPVSGVVTLDGRPLTNAKVTFRPRRGPSSSGVTDGRGRFQLTTFRDDPGAVVGEHRVAIYSPTVKKSSASDVDPPRSSKQKVPLRYNDMTELTFEVRADGSDQANFELSSANGSNSH